MSQAARSRRAMRTSRILDRAPRGSVAWGSVAAIEPLPAGVVVGDYVRHGAGRWELARYGTALAVLIGIIPSVLPRGR